MRKIQKIEVRLKYVFRHAGHGRITTIRRRIIAFIPQNTPVRVART